MILYYEVSTLYALGSVLAYSRILLLDGLYSQVEQLIPGLGIFLKQKLDDFGKELDRNIDNPFYRYDRLSLAEVVMERADGRLRTCTYLDFKAKYEADDNLHMRESLKSAKVFVAKLRPQTAERLMKVLSTIATRIGDETGIRTHIGEQNST